MAGCMGRASGVKADSREKLRAAEDSGGE